MGRFVSTLLEILDSAFEADLPAFAEAFVSTLLEILDKIMAIAFLLERVYVSTLLEILELVCLVVVGF